MLNFCNLFFSSITIKIIITTIVVSQWKQLNLSIINEKPINLRDFSSLSLLIWTYFIRRYMLYPILSLTFAFSLIYCVSCLVSYLISYVLRLLLCFLLLLCVLCIISLIFTLYLICCIFCFVSYLMSCII